MGAFVPGLENGGNCPQPKGREGGHLPQWVEPLLCTASFVTYNTRQLKVPVCLQKALWGLSTCPIALALVAVKKISLDMLITLVKVTRL